MPTPQFNPPSPAGWQFMSRELERLADRMDAGLPVNEHGDDAGSLRDIAMILRQHADRQGAAPTWDQMLGPVEDGDLMKERN